MATSEPQDSPLAVDTADIVAVLEARMAIEVESARLAAVRRTPVQLRAMRSALALRQARGASDGRVTADIAFHRAVVVASNNPVLLEIFDAFIPRTSEAMEGLRKMKNIRIYDPFHHQQVVDSIEAGDPQLAARLTRGHLAKLADALSRAA